MDNSYILIVLRLCTLGTELCDSAEPHQCFYANDVKVQDVLFTLTPSFAFFFLTDVLRVPYP
jgi:hypothetical protein